MVAKIKSCFNTFLSVLEEAGRARAAAVLARQGKVEEARRLILEK